LLFSQYANPFLFINTLIKGKRLYEGIDFIIADEVERKNWQLYCACAANPFAEMKPYEEWKTTNTAKPEMSELDINDTVKKSDNILNGFIPPK